MSWPAHDVVLASAQRIFTFFRASSLLSELKAFSASISKMASVSGFAKLVPQAVGSIIDPTILA